MLCIILSIIIGLNIVKFTRVEPQNDKYKYGITSIYDTKLKIQDYAVGVLEYNFETHSWSIESYNSLGEKIIYSLNNDEVIFEKMGIKYKVFEWNNKLYSVTLTSKPT